MHYRYNKLSIKYENISWYKYYSVRESPNGASAYCRPFNVIKFYPLPGKQSFWDWPGLLTDRALIESSLAEPSQRARFLAAQAPHSGDWLPALPTANCGLRRGSASSCRYEAGAQFVRSTQLSIDSFKVVLKTHLFDCLWLNTYCCRDSATVVTVDARPCNVSVVLRRVRNCWSIIIYYYY